MQPTSQMIEYRPPPRPNCLVPAVISRRESSPCGHFSYTWWWSVSDGGKPSQQQRSLNHKANTLNRRSVVDSEYGERNKPAWHWPCAVLCCVARCTTCTVAERAGGGGWGWGRSRTHSYHWRRGTHKHSYIQRLHDSGNSPYYTARPWANVGLLMGYKSAVISLCMYFCWLWGVFAGR